MQTKRKVVLRVLVIVLMLRNPGLLFVNAASYNYQDQDVVMLLPEEREEAASMMTVLKPFDVGLWCTIAGSLIYAVSVTWLLEQRKRSEQRSEQQRSEQQSEQQRSEQQRSEQQSEQSSTGFFTHICSRAINMSSSRFTIQSWLARIVSSIWLVVMAVIVFNYSTNYNSMLINVQKVNVNEILASDGAIGYLKHHFSPSYQDWSENLKAYTTEEECAKALSQGPNRGGVGVILMDRLDALHFISRRPGYTYYDIPPQADTPRSLGVLDLMVWFIITGTASTLGLIRFIFDLLYRRMHRRAERLPYSWMDGPAERLPYSWTDRRTVRRRAPATGEHRPTALLGREPPSDSLEMATQSDSLETSLLIHTAPVTEMRRDNRAATSSPVAEGNASAGNDDEDRGDDDKVYNSRERALMDRMRVYDDFPYDDDYLERFMAMIRKIRNGDEYTE